MSEKVTIGIELVSFDSKENAVGIKLIGTDIDLSNQ